MFFNHPVLATAVGGIPEVCPNSETSFLYKVGDITGFKEGILKLFNDRKILDEMGKRAHSFAVDNFSTKKILEQYIKCYMAILKEVY